MNTMPIPKNMFVCLVIFHSIIISSRHDHICFNTATNESYFSHPSEWLEKYLSKRSLIKGRDKLITQRLMNLEERYFRVYKPGNALWIKEKCLNTYFNSLCVNLSQSTLYECNTHLVSHTYIRVTFGYLFTTQMDFRITTQEFFILSNQNQDIFLSRRIVCSKLATTGCESVISCAL